MNGLLSFAVVTLSDGRRFLEGLETVGGYLGSYDRCIGSEPLDLNHDMTDCLQSFNLPNTVGPFDWPERERPGDVMRWIDYYEFLHHGLTLS